jgi:hypothetical protein
MKLKRNFIGQEVPIMKTLLNFFKKYIYTEVQNINSNNI